MFEFIIATLKEDIYTLEKTDKRLSDLFKSLFNDIFSFFNMEKSLYILSIVAFTYFKNNESAKLFVFFSFFYLLMIILRNISNIFEKIKNNKKINLFMIVSVILLTLVLLFIGHITLNYPEYLPIILQMTILIFFIFVIDSVIYVVKDSKLKKEKDIERYKRIKEKRIISMDDSLNEIIDSSFENDDEVEVYLLETIESKLDKQLDCLKIFMPFSLFLIAIIIYVYFPLFFQGDILDSSEIANKIFEIVNVFLHDFFLKGVLNIIEPLFLIIIFIVLLLLITYVFFYQFRKYNLYVELKSVLEMRRFSSQVYLEPKHNTIEWLTYFYVISLTVSIVYLSITCLLAFIN